MGKFTIREKNGKYSFRLKAGNGEIIATSQMYKSLKTCRAGIDMQHVVTLVVHHSQYVRMAGHEYVGFLGLEKREELLFVMTGIAADVGHDDFVVFADKQLRSRNHQASVPVVGVAVYRHYRLEFAQPLPYALEPEMAEFHPGGGVDVESAAVVLD